MKGGDSKGISQLWCGIFFFVLCLAGVVLVFSQEIAVHLQQSDFYSYWLFFQQLSRGNNPYSYENLMAIAVHSDVGPVSVGPWTILPLSLIYAHSFPVAVCLYLGVQIASLVIAFLLVPIIFPSATRTISIFLVGILGFSPFYLDIYYGQLGIFMMVCAYGVVAAYLCRMEMLTGVLFALICIKPHIAYLLWVFLFILLLRERRWRTIVSAGVTLLLFMGYAEITFPGIAGMWMEAGNRPLGWISASLLTPLRFLFAWKDDPFPALPGILVPLGLIVTTAFFALRVRSENFKWYLPGLLILSLLFSPHLWPFDYAVLVGMQIVVLSEKWRPIVILELIALHLGFLLQFASDENSIQMAVYWFPVALYAIWHTAIYRSSARALSGERS